MNLDQRELFPVAPDVPEPGARRKLRASATGQTCKRKLPSGGICGHPKSRHRKPSDTYETHRFEPQPRLICLDCGCREFQAKEFRNPFLETENVPESESVPKVCGLTMCKICRHAKRDHHRARTRYRADGTCYQSGAYCTNLIEQDGHSTDCSCIKFVNPFSKPRTKAKDTQQPELFSPAATTLNQTLRRTKYDSRTKNQCGRACL
jgi:hypothetical protein